MCCSIFCILVHCYCLYYISQNQDVCSYRTLYNIFVTIDGIYITTFHIRQFLISNKYGRALTLHSLYNCTTKLQYLHIHNRYDYWYNQNAILLEVYTQIFELSFLTLNSKHFHNCLYWYRKICEMLLTLNTYFHKLALLKVSTWKLISK